MFSNNRFVIPGIASGGTISAFHIVQRDTANDDEVIAGTLNCRALGVAPEYDNLVGVSFPIQVGGVAQVKLGVGGAIRGDSIISDATGLGIVPGNGVANGLSNYCVVGLAERTGNAGDVIPVQIEIYNSTVVDY